MRPNYLRRETEAIIRKVPLVRPPRQIIVLIFIFLYCFFPSHVVSDIFLSLFDTFSHRNIKKENEFILESLIPQGQQHVSSAQQSSALYGRASIWMGDQMQIPCVVITFFLFFPFLFKGNIKNCRTVIPVYCRFFLLFINFFFLISPLPYLCVFFCIIV